ncbi:MAG: hypothetical protein E6J34_00830 [Chloroflexi bacterium]|nr:MAG: hypothetical protein E6J34_00830 [Chloroflexota bacterium]
MTVSEPTKTLLGDPDCKLGVKKSTNQEQADGSTKKKKEHLWGYGSGVAAAIIADYDDIVLAEYTQPFNQNDITYFRPLYERVVLALNAFPTYITADAAFDAWYVYEAAVRHGGNAAVPLNAHSKNTFDPDGTPHCPIGLRMHPVFHYAHRSGLSCSTLPLPAPLPRSHRPDLRA